MPENHNQISVNRTAVLILVFMNAIILKHAYLKDSSWYWLLLVTVPLLFAAIVSMYKQQYK